ncbi:MAG: META domain-containing protein [Bacteroidota bacterium]
MSIQRTLHTNYLAMLPYKTTRTVLCFLCFAACLAALCFAGCTSVDNPPASTALAGTTWTITETSAPDTQTERPNAGDFTISFLVSGQVAGNEMCNACGGTYTLMGDKTVQIDVGCNEAGCGLWSTTYLVRAYPSGLYTYELNGEELVLNEVEQARKFILKRVPAPVL